MATFLFVYRTPSEVSAPTEDGMAAWNAWFETLGSAIVNPGNPVVARTTVGDVKASQPVGGYTVITANDLESAATLAKGCPLVGHGGGVEVGELSDMM
jgi:hypothetical protein